MLCFVAQSCPTLCNPMDCSPPGSSVHGDSPSKNTGVGFHALLQGIFPTQGSNPGLSHCRWILYQVSYQGSPHICIFLQKDGSKRIFLKSINTQGLREWNCDSECDCILNIYPYLYNHREKAMAPHSSTVARKIPWMEEPGGLQSMGSLRVRHD